MPEVSHRRGQAIAALLSEKTIVGASRRCGVSERTLRRWLADPTFRAAYAEQSQRALEDALATIRASATEALTVLRELLAPEQVPAVRLRAATELLGAALKVTDADVLARLDEFDRRLSNEWGAARPPGRQGAAHAFPPALASAR
jgi:hypothetical protein